MYRASAKNREIGLTILQLLYRLSMIFCIPRPFSGSSRMHEPAARRRIHRSVPVPRSHGNSRGINNSATTVSTSLSATPSLSFSSRNDNGTSRKHSDLLASRQSEIDPLGMSTVVKHLFNLQFLFETA